MPTLTGPDRGQWVIDNYEKLLPRIQQAERTVLSTEYGLPINNIHV